MRLIALDLSTARTGVAIFSESGDLVERFSIVPDDKLHPYMKIKFIVDALRPRFLEVTDCIVEGIFLNTFSSGQHGVVGFETLARLSGAVIDAWLHVQDTIPTLFKATEARKLVGIKGTCQKADVQVFIAAKYKYATEEQLDTFQAMIDSEEGAYLHEDFTKSTWKKHMDNISTYIEGETELGEDEADAVLLGESYFVAKKQGKI